MINVFESAGFEVARLLSGGEVELTFPIAATADYTSRVEARDHTAVVASLRPFFEAQSVAVLGASSRRGTIGGELFATSWTASSRARRTPSTATASPSQGCVATAPSPTFPIRSISPSSVSRRRWCSRRSKRSSTPESGPSASSRPVRGVGSEGEERQNSLLGLIRAHGARLLGPNCLGISSAAVRLNATFASRAAPPGNIGFSSQSGALGLALLEATESRGLGLSAFVSIGNKADVSSNDLLEWWEDDPATEIVLLYLESFGNPRTFATLARRVARTKPILAVKSGTTGAGARAASSHTAALAGSESAVDALFHQAGSSGRPRSRSSSMWPRCSRHSRCREAAGSPC